jgi:glucose-6-phosphate 1-dehydrogenase
LNQTLRHYFPEDDIFHVDHYLGKEAVQNLLYFRFANSFLEPIWNNNYIRASDYDGGDLRRRGRGAFYEEAIRDVIQNHLLQRRLADDGRRGVAIWTACVTPRPTPSRRCALSSRRA